MTNMSQKNLSRKMMGEKFTLWLLCFTDQHLPHTGAFPYTHPCAICLYSQSCYQKHQVWRQQWQHPPLIQRALQGKPSSGCELAVFPTSPGKLRNLCKFTAGLVSSPGPSGIETLGKKAKRTWTRHEAG